MNVDEAVDELNKKEDYHMKVLNTFHPLGLNDRQYGGGCVSNKFKIDSIHFSTPIPRRKRSHGVRKSGRKKLNVGSSCNNRLQQLSELFDSKSFASFYKLLRSIKDSELRYLYGVLKSSGSLFACVFTSFYFFHFGKSLEQNSPNERVSLIFRLFCRNVDLVNLASLVGDKRISCLLPNELKDQFPPRVFFKLNTPISLQICNYSKILKTTSLDDIKEIVAKDCLCQDKSLDKFVCNAYGHVFTGDLDIVEDSNLRNIMKFGSKFRLEQYSPWDKVLMSLLDDLVDNAHRLSRKLKVSLSQFQPWIDKMYEVIGKRVSKLKSNHNMSTPIKNLATVSKPALSKLHDKFVVTTVDKAANNFAVICKKFFFTVLLNELGFDKDSFLPVGNITYLPVTDTASSIVDRHVIVLKDKFKVVCTNLDLVLPKIFWVPKLHKNPYKFRFIAGARHCSTKPLSVIVNLGLSVVKENFRLYCNAIQRNNGFNFFWSINSTIEFLDRIRTLKVHNVQVYDFSTLYTNLDQSKIVEHINSLFDLVFNSSNRKYLCIRTDKSFFSSRTYNSYHCFDLSLFKDAVKFIVSEVFVSFGGLVFRQTRGIPMGGNSSPLLADLFLAHCEFQYMSTLLKEKKFGLARLLSSTTRYIDDLCFFNYKHFQSIKDSIYPSDLAADRSGSNDKVVNYLDVKLIVNEDGLHSSVYHKVQDFDFNVILLTFPNSLIPLQMGGRIYAGQILRYLRICSNIRDFINKALETTQLLKSRGYSSSNLQYCMEKILSKHNYLLSKFNLFSSRQVSNLIGFSS